MSLLENKTTIVEDKRGISGFTVKCIACMTMLCSHLYLALGLSEQWIFLNQIGRVAFPIYCFMLIEGFFHTSNKNRYFYRLILFALVSEFPFDIALTGQTLEFGHQNVFFTLAIGFAMLMLIQRSVTVTGKVIVLFAAMELCSALQTDYGAFGIWVIFCFYLGYHRPWRNGLLHGVNQLLIARLVYGTIQMYAFFAIVPLALYNGRRGRSWKCFFYLFYPIHLFILGMLRLLI